MRIARALQGIGPTSMTIRQFCKELAECMEFFLQEDAEAQKIVDLAEGGYRV